ncbi:MAG: DUF167 domain-containing protein [Phycisphaerae bacterium]|nr:DUF167 domain-containing protein [Phycisphaerae bacterium]
MKDVEKIDIQNTPDGAVVTIKAVPNASRDKLVGVLDHALKVAVSAPAEKGRANDAIAKTLAKVLGVPVRTIRLVHGQTHPRKQFLVADTDVQYIRDRLYTQK